MLESLADYRLRYASYKLDPDLQAAHARFPFVATWDDHEVANNYMGDTVPDGAAADAVKAQKAAAYQAWWENMPTRLDPPDGSDLAVYRDFAIGDLAALYLLDERQDAADAAVPRHLRPRGSTTATAPTWPTRTAPASAPTRRRGSRTA